jgi:predicted HTH transcriptional regulator
VREAIANAVVHRDLSITEAVIRLFVFDRHLELDSPGGLLPGLTVATLSLTTRLRNRKLAELLYHVGYIERQGTGIRRMQRAMQAAGLPEPAIENLGQSLFVGLHLDDGLASGARRQSTATGDGGGVPATAAGRAAPARVGDRDLDEVPLEDEVPEEVEAAVQGVRRNPQVVESLNIRQRRLLTVLRERGGITRVEYENLFHVAPRTAKRDLKGLLDAGLIAHRGSSTASYYVLA